MHVTVRNLSNLLPARWVCRKSAGNNSIFQFGYSPLALRKGGPFAEWNKDSDYPLEDTTALTLIF